MVNPQPTPLPGLHAWIDARNGVAGDMLLGALLDAGAPLGGVRDAVEAVIPGTVRITAGTVRRAGLRATKADVERIAADQPHRHWAEVRDLIEQADLTGGTRSRALAVFARLAEAEGRAHGVPAEQVHFHEVGAWDSIADVVGIAAALDLLGVATVSAGPVAVGAGTVRTSHGEMPVPVPAVLELAVSWQVIGGGETELATPTGMAVVVALADRCADLPALTVAAVGVGAGSREVEGRPNAVRVVLGTPATAAGPAGGDHAVVLEANVNDLDPRVWPSVLSGLLDAGAADAWLVPIVMKKGRPAHTLTVLAEPGRAADLRERILDLVPTLGLRETWVRKAALDRTWRSLDVDGSPVRIKVAHTGGVIRTATPEFDDVARAAANHGVAVRVLLGRAVAAAERAGLSPGRPLPE